MSDLGPVVAVASAATARSTGLRDTSPVKTPEQGDADDEVERDDLDLAQEAVNAPPVGAPQAGKSKKALLNKRELALRADGQKFRETTAKKVHTGRTQERAESHRKEGDAFQETGKKTTAAPPPAFPLTSSTMLATAVPFELARGDASPQFDAFVAASRAGHTGKHAQTTFHDSTFVASAQLPQLPQLVSPPLSQVAAKANTQSAGKNAEEKAPPQKAAESTNELHPDALQKAEQNAGTAAVSLALGYKLFDPGSHTGAGSGNPDALWGGGDGEIPELTGEDERRDFNKAVARPGDQAARLWGA